MFVFPSATYKYTEHNTKNYNFSCYLHGRGNWSLASREEHRTRVFHNRVLRKICGAKREEATGEWRKLHNEELYDLNCSPNIIQVIKSRMRWVGHVAHMEKTKGGYRVLVGKPEGKRPLAKPRHRWQQNKMDGRACTGFTWLWTVTSGSLLFIW